MEQHPIIIVGAGLAGLACALELAERGHRPLLLEAADAPGGRVRTDVLDGFRLDRGFQVLQTAYPEARRLLDYPALDLRPFEPGALIHHLGRFYTISDPWRRPLRAFATLFTPIGSLSDKLRVAMLRMWVLKGSLTDLYRREETTTLDALRRFGFTDAIIERFFRPFIAGVFFDPDLKMSSRAFEFVFRAFAAGDTALPAQGMGAISQQLADRLPPESLRLNTRVAAIDQTTALLESGERIEGRAVVIATDGRETARLLNDPRPFPTYGTTCLYFAAAKPPVWQPYLILNGDNAGPINSIVMPSVLSAAYAPTGQTLVTVNMLGVASEDDAILERRVRVALTDWFGADVAAWRLVRIYRIRHALPAQRPPVKDPTQSAVQARPGVFFCGEYQNSPSIQWALVSGSRAAVAVHESLGGAGR